MAVKISDLKPNESLVTELNALSEKDTSKICGGGGGSEGTGGDFSPLFSKIYLSSTNF
ncbi:MAG: hypothetical protein ACR9NN_23200 [Nostochopsis sp.]